MVGIVIRKLAKHYLKDFISNVKGLVNGSTGTVVGIKWTALRDEPLQDGDLPEILIVRFDGNMGGRHKDINGYVRVQCSTFEFPGRVIEFEMT